MIILSAISAISSISDIAIDDDTGTVRYGTYAGPILMRKMRKKVMSSYHLVISLILKSRNFFVSYKFHA